MATGLTGIKTLKDFEFAGKTVFLRLDLNVPMAAGKITDENRITASLPTIRYLQEKGAKLVLASHFGRPKKSGDPEFSLEPVARRLGELLSAEVILIDEPDSDAPKALLPSLKKDQILLLENLRYNEGETENSIEFAQKLSAYSDIYINDAFGASHRAHSSIEALPSVMNQKGIGLLIEKEIQMLEVLLASPERPYWAILGGSKVSDKIPVIERLIDVVDGFIIGGAMAYTFLKAQNQPVGKSLVEGDKLRYAKEMLERIKARGKSVLLPVDHIVADSIKSPTSASVVELIPEDKMALDIGPKTLSLYASAIAKAQTVFWNGPMGVFEVPEFSKGTFGVAKTLSEGSGLRIVGGGDSAAAAEMSGFADKMSHISTGGGASLEYLQGEKLPGLEILRAKKSSEKNIES